jgi:hypothetical protein
MSNVMQRVDEKMIAIADRIRERNSITDKLSLDDMAAEIVRIGMNGGTDTSDATASADEIFLNETAYVNGEKVTGTFTIEDEVNSQTDLISQIASALEGKALANLQDKAVYPTTEEQIVMPDDGYDGLSSVRIAGDADLIAQNIVSGVNIFGVIGIASGSGGGGGAEVETCTVTINMDESRYPAYCLIPTIEGGYISSNFVNTTSVFSNAIKNSKIHYFFQEDAHAVTDTGDNQDYMNRNYLSILSLDGMAIVHGYSFLLNDNASITFH